jgi:hypothetical protein
MFCRSSCRSLPAAVRCALLLNQSQAQSSKLKLIVVSKSSNEGTVSSVSEPIKERVWIHNTGRIQISRPMRIHANLDPDPGHYKLNFYMKIHLMWVIGHKRCLSYTTTFLRGWNSGLVVAPGCGSGSLSRRAKSTLIHADPDLQS